MSTEAEEIQEFLAVVQTALIEESKPAPRLPSPSSLEDCSSKEESTVKVVDFVQYSKVGNNGFLPTGETIPIIPPGIYMIESINKTFYFARQTIVTDKLLRLPDSRSDEVIGEIERFWTPEMKLRFLQYGFTHKRGILMWGPPGSGKTCTVDLIMEQMVRSGGVVIIGDCPPAVLTDALKAFRQIESMRPAVVILEDIDALIERYGESNILSLLDGESSINNVVYLATTNYPERLDTRITNRPSRFDRVVKIGMPNAMARLAYLLSRDLDMGAAELDQWVQMTEGFSVAHLKELVVLVKCYELDIEIAVERLRAMASHPKSSDHERPAGFRDNGSMKTVSFRHGN